MTFARVITFLFALLCLICLPITSFSQPDIDFDWPIGFEFNQPDNWNDAFAELFSGGPYELTGIVTNFGDELLEVEASTDNEVFTVEPTNFEVDPGGELQITVTFEAPEPGEYEANLIFHSNDPDNGELRIAMVAEAMNPPDILPIDELFVEMNSGEIRREVITIENDGGAPLRFTVDIEVMNEPERDDAGDLLGEFSWQGVGGNSYKGGIAYDPENEYLLLTGFTSQLCAVVDPNDDYAEVTSWRTEGAPMGATWLNCIYYVIEYQNGIEQIHRYDGEGNAIGLFADFLDGVISITSSPEHNLILLTEAENAFDIDAYDPDNAELIGRIRPYPGWIEEYQIWSMTWVDKHTEGQLWLQFEGQWLYQLEIDLENFELVNRNQIVRLETPPDNNRNRRNGLGHDKDNLIYGRYDQETYWILDDGISEVYWITVEPMEGEVEPNGSLDLVVTLDATHMRSGEYVADVHILTNDPDNNNMVFSVTMDVRGPDWDYEAEWHESAGYPESINFEMAYEATFAGDSDTIGVEVSNVGFHELTIDEIRSDNEAFRAVPGNFMLGEGEEIEVLVIFTPADGGEYDGVLTFFTNDPDEAEVQVPLHGLAILPPRMRVIGEDIDEFPWQGEVIEHEITIANDGGSPLRFEIDIENEVQPNRDVVPRALRSVDGRASKPFRDDPGDLIGQFNGNNAVNQYCSPIGWDWDNEGMWVSNYSAQNLVRWGHDARYENFEEQIRFNRGPFMDGAWAKGLLYLPNWANATVNRYNDQGQNVGAINMPFPVYGMAVDVENDWLMFLNPNDGMSIYVYELTDHGGLGDQLGVIRNHAQYYGNVVAYNLEWVPKHPDGQLWMTNAQTGRVHQIAVDTDNWQCTGEAQNPIQVFPRAEQPYSSVAHDGHNLWAAGYFSGNIRIYDDGVEEANWLRVAPDNGIVQPDGEELVTVTIDTHNLLGGEYSAELHIYSNDPQNPEHIIHVEMTGNDWNWEVDPPRIEVTIESFDLLSRAYLDDPIVEHMTIVNQGQEGGENLEFYILASLDDIDNRQARGPRNAGLDGENTRRLRRVRGGVIGPLRDAPESNFCLFKDGGGWGNQMEDVWQQEDVDITIYNSNRFENFPIDEYDVIWIREYQSDEFNTNYNNNRSRFEEWVDGGGVLYHGVGTNNWNVAPIHVGGLVRERSGSANGRVNVSNNPRADDYNYLADLCDWEGGEQLRGQSWSHAGYTIQSLQNIQNSDRFQVIATGIEGQALPGVVVYSYGRGCVMVTGTTDSFSYLNYRNRGQWGWALNNVVWYLDYLAQGTMPWLTITPEEGSLAPGAEREIELSFDVSDLGPGYYEGHLSIDSNDPANSNLEIPIGLELWAPEPPPFDGPEPTEFSHSLLITAVQFDGDPVDPGWEIGVFTPDGVLCGITVWRGEQEGIAVWGADDDHEDYFHDGEVMSFIGYDPRSDQEYQLVADVEEGSLIWHNEGLTILSLEANTLKQQTIPLRQGWNFVSLNVAPVDQILFAGDPGPEVIPMLAQLRRPNNGAHHVLRFKDFIGRFYSPGNGFNNIPFWNLEQGYMVLVDEPLEVVWQGSPIDAQADIPLREGWNIAPYYPTYQLPASRASQNYVISPIIDNVLIAKDVNGNFMIPGRDYFSNMPPWHEGQAYQIKVNQTVTLNYPVEQNQMAGGIPPQDDPAAADRTSISTYFHPVSLTGANMSLLLTLIPAKAGIHSAEIGIFTPRGLCVGASPLNSTIYNLQFTIGLAVWGDDPSTPEIDGALEGEPLTLQFSSGEDRHSCLSQPLFYETDGFAEATLVLPDASQLSSFNFQLFPPSPNPFNSTTRTKFSLSEPGHVKLGIFEPSGRLVRNILEGNYASGEHETLIDGKSLPAGIYFARLEAAGAIQLQKIVLTK